MTRFAADRASGDVDRRRAVVLNADIADYSRHLADDEAATVATVRAYQRAVADAVATGRGTLVNFVGDSFVAVFDDARAAMRTGIAICQAVHERNGDLPRTRQMWFRLGLDVGDVVVIDDGRHFGDALNIAARVQAIADVGGINVTERIYRELDEPGLRLVPLGPRRLRNIPEMVRVYRLAGVGAGNASRHRDRPMRPSVAVLPVVGADDAATRDIAQALRLEVVRALADIPALRVIDMAVASASGDRRSDLEVDLGAAYILESCVLRSGDRLRAYVMVFESATMNRVWAKRWDGPVGDVFALQDALTVAMVRAFEIDLVIGEPARIYRAELDGTAIAAVYHGWHQFVTATPDAWHRAVESFESVATSHPETPVGPALAAFVRWWGAVHGLSDDPESDHARAAVHARRGIELGDDTGLSQTVVAALLLHAGDDLDAALSAANEAILRRPTCDVSFAVSASVHRYLGAWEPAVEAGRRAIELSRIPKPWFMDVLASAHYVGEQYHDAADVAQQRVDRFAAGGDLEALLVLAAAQQALGLTRRARATARTIRDRFPGFRRDELSRRHPFRDPAVLQRWFTHLAAAGVP